MLLGTSSTAAKLKLGWPASTVPMPNAPPWLASTLNSLTNLPDLVNSTISLGWVGSALTASPLAVSRFPLGANTNARGPRKFGLAKIGVPFVTKETVFPAFGTAKICCRLLMPHRECRWLCRRQAPLDRESAHWGRADRHFPSQFR